MPLNLEFPNTFHSPALPNSHLTRLSTMAANTELESVNPGLQRQSVEMNEADSSGKNMKKTLKQFVESVSICGLESAWKAKMIAEKILWYTAFVLAVIGATVTTYGSVSHYMEATTVYDDFLIFNKLGPFPNVTICSPMAVNKSKLLDILVVPPKVRAMAARKKKNINDIIEFTLDFWQYDIKNKDYGNKLLEHAAHEIMEATAAEYPGGFASTVRDSTPPCDFIFNDCSFYGQPFKCCDAAQFIFFDGFICYYFAVTRIHELAITAAVSGGSMDDTVRAETSGMSLRVNVDWELTSFYDSLADDGYQIFIGPMGTFLSDPVAIPSGADAVITLASPYKVEERDQCHRPASIPKLSVTQYYDQYGLNCISDKLITMMTKSIGCTIPFYAYTPDGNQTECSSAIIFFVAEQISQVSFDIDFKKNNDSLVKMLSNDQMQRMQSQLRQYQAVGNAVVQIPKLMTAECKPLCSRWTYRVASASYGYFQQRGQEHWEEENKRNQTWSQIRVFFPEAYYHLRSQEATFSMYSIMWETGGLMGVYFGTSAITMIQVIFYGLFVCHAARRSVTSSGSRVT